MSSDAQKAMASSVYDKFSGEELMLMIHRENPAKRADAASMSEADLVAVVKGYSTVYLRGMATASDYASLSKDELVARVNSFRKLRDDTWPKPGNADPFYDLIVEDSLAKNEYPKAKMDAARAAEHTSLAAKCCTQEVWDKYKDQVSTGAAKWTLARAVNSGTMYPHSFVGCHAGDQESWDDFKDFFYPVIEAYHVGFSMETGQGTGPDGKPLPPLAGTAQDRMDPAKIGVDLSESAKEKIVSTRIRIARNLTGFALNPGGDGASRDKIAALLKKVYAGIEDPKLKGEMFRHDTMSNEQRQALIDGHQMFRGCDKMQAASGYHVDWPIGRGVFHNPDKSFVNWINEGDHIRIIAMGMGSDVKGIFSTLSAGTGAVSEGLKKNGPVGEEGGKYFGMEPFQMHPKFGAITCCPSNLGTGMRGSVHIKIPKLIKAWGFKKIDSECRKRMCQARGSSGEHSEVVDRVGISNWRRIGIPEYMLLQDMINCVNWIVTEEDKLGGGK